MESYPTGDITATENITPKAARWMDLLRTLSVDDVLDAAEIESEPKGFRPCLVCGDDQRGYTHRDRRPPVGLTANHMGWRCHRCAAGGDAISLIAVLATGEKRPEDWQPVKAWAEGHGLLPSSSKSPGPVSVHRPPRRERPAPAPPKYPPIEELAALWERCVPVCDDSAVSGWLRGRKIDPSRVEDLGLARALPVDAVLPTWARTRSGTWTKQGARLIVPMVDATGRVRSLRGRRLGDVHPKELAPTNYEVRGLILADSLARLLLAGEALWGGPESAEAVRGWGVVITEGVPDFITTATLFGDAREDAPAVLGVISGSWTDGVAARVPSGSVVVLATHQDKAGKKYAELVYQSLGGRCYVRVARELRKEGTGQ